MQLSASPPLLYTDLKPSHAQAAHLVYSYAWARPKVDTVASIMISWEKGGAQNAIASLVFVGHDGGVDAKPDHSCCHASIGRHSA